MRWRTQARNAACWRVWVSVKVKRANAGAAGISI
jgi:hypothetical protein